MRGSKQIRSVSPTYRPTLQAVFAAVAERQVARAHQVGAIAAQGVRAADYRGSPHIPWQGGDRFPSILDRARSCRIVERRRSSSGKRSPVLFRSRHLPVDPLRAFRDQPVAERGEFWLPVKQIIVRIFSRKCRWPNWPPRRRPMTYRLAVFWAAPAAVGGLSAPR